MAHKFKLIILGTIDVGKTSLALRFADGVFDPDRTVDIDTKSKSIVVEGKTVELTIADTAGQERFRTLTSSYYRNSDAIIIVFDLTSQDSFADVKGHLVEATRYSVRSEKFIIGNKADLPNRVITPDAAQALCDSEGVTNYMETSAKTGANVEEFFAMVASKLLKSSPVGASPKDSIILTTSSHGESSSSKSAPKNSFCTI
ncbi:MAG: Rab family GTPase [archaeon]|nr:Rab family GTPase [archaeon]